MLASPQSKNYHVVASTRPCVAFRRRIEEAERAQLLSRSDVNSHGGWRDTIDEDAQAMGYVQNSKRALEEAFQTGTAILTNMAGQRERLKACLLGFPLSPLLAA